MKRIHRRPFVLVVAGLAALALFFLAAGLANLELKPAERFISPGETQTPRLPFGESIAPTSFAEQLILLGGLIILFVLLLLLLSPEMRKRVLWTLARTALLAWVIFWAMAKFRRPTPLPEESALQPAMKASEVVGTPVAYSTPMMPPWLTYVTSLFVVIGLAALGWWLWRRIRRPVPPLGKIASVARSALADLSAGRDWEDAVVRCYARMSAALDARRNLRRRQAMTPSEFALRLEQAGLPADPVHRLTRLFEKVRYGGRRSSPTEVNEAVVCLTAILQYCGEGL